MAAAGVMRWCGRTLLALLVLLAAGPARAQVQVLGVTASPATPVLLGQPVQFTGQASVPGGGALEYRWDFGDGSPRTAWLPVNTVGYDYPRPGAYTVLLQVRHASQGLASATVPLVVRLPAGPAARASAPILVHAPRREVWVANPDHGSVGVLDADQLVFLAEIDVGAQPSALALDEGGQVWIVLEGDDRLVRIDPVTRTITASVALGYGARPVAVLFDAAGWGYVALAGAGQVRRFHAVSGQLQAALAMGPHPHALALSADGTGLFVSRLVSAGNSGSIHRIGLPAFAAVATIDLPLDSSSPDSGTAARGLPNYVAALALPEHGEPLWYGGKKDNILRGLFREGQALTFESSMRSLIGRVGVAGLAEQVAARIDLDDSGRVSALLPAPGSSHLFAALEANNTVVVLDPWNRTVLAELAVGRAPRGLAFDPATRRLFVQNLLSRSVSVFAVGAQLDDGVAPVQALGEIASAVGEPLAPQVLRGKQVFHDATDPRMTQDGYFSCGGCHLDGRGDGRVWDFSQLGEGLRNTTSLLGNAGMGRGLVHWSGNFDEIQDFEVPIRNLFGGSGFMADADYFSDGRDHPLGPAKAGFSEDLDALAAYVASLDRDDRSPQRSFDGSLTADGVAGRALFASLSCGRCHAGPAFTDSAAGLRHDVGTLGGGSGQRLGGPLLALDTPSLRGLSGSAPYLHDGSAATLDEVLMARNPDGRHGSVGALYEAQRQQLVDFLLQIDGSEPALAGTATLVVSAPATGSSVDAGQPVALAIATDLPQLVRVDYRIDGAIVATALAPPWTASWTAAGNGAVQVQADVRHDLGQFQSLSAPVALTVVAGDAVYANGFEP
jgi:YVTN family beta-propeller protein